MSVCLAVTLTAAGVTEGIAGQEDGDGKITARSYEIRHRTLTDAVDLVGPILSDEGRVSIQPRLRRLIVQDTGAVLDRVAALLESFDLPPRNVEVTVTLFMGSDKRDEEAGRHAPQASISREVKGVVETLADFTKWIEYDPLGSRSITCVEQGEVMTDLTDGYRVSFIVDSVNTSKGIVTFKDFTLRKVVQTVSGKERVENLFMAGIAVQAGRTLMLGAAKSPESRRALFLAIQANPR